MNFDLSGLPFIKWLYPIPVVIKRKDGSAKLDWGKKEASGDIVLLKAKKSIPARVLDGGMVYLYTDNDQDYFPVEIKESGKKLEPLPYDLRLRYVLEREKIFNRAQQKGKYDQLIPVISLMFVMITGIMLYISFDKQGQFVNAMTSASGALATATLNMTQYCMGR